MKPITQFQCGKCGIKHIYVAEATAPQSYAYCSQHWTNEPPTPEQIDMEDWRQRARPSTLVTDPLDCPVLSAMQDYWRQLKSP